MRWKKTSAVCAVATIFVGAALLRFCILNGAEENWKPIQLPFPAPGMSVSDRFRLASGGKFVLRVVTSVPKAEQTAINREVASIDVAATFAITGPEGFRITQTITRLESSSWSGDTESYTAADMFALPRRGEYDFVFQNGKRVALFADRGGIIQFDRLAPSGYGLTYLVAEGLAYFCFIVASALSLLIGMRR